MKIHFPIKSPIKSHEITMKPPFKAPQLFAPAFEIVTALTSPAEPMDIRRSRRSPGAMRGG